MNEAFETWFKELYIREGFVSRKAELYAAWRAAMLAERARWTEAVMYELDSNGQAHAIVTLATSA